MSTPSTSTRILDIAERLVQTRGYNGFSYADIAEALHVTKASLHYHFPAKAELGRKLIERYEENFVGALGKIDAQARNPREKLKSYAALYEGVLADDRMCLCGMLAAESATLPKAMREQLKRYFDANERWLVEVLKEGKRSKDLKFAGAPEEAARAIVGALEGAMMLARSYGDAKRFKSVSARLIGDFSN